ncbi:hypothetical protein ACS0TY_020489 [Phlomoides rotata]
MSSTTSSSTAGGSQTVYFCGKETCIRTSWTNNNPDRRFHGCKDWNRVGGGCEFFKWYDSEMSPRAKYVILSLLKEKREFVKPENQEKNEDWMKYSLIASWVFFFAVWVLMITIPPCESPRSHACYMIRFRTCVCTIVGLNLETRITRDIISMYAPRTVLSTAPSINPLTIIFH